MIPTLISGLSAIVLYIWVLLYTLRFPSEANPASNAIKRQSPSKTTHRSDMTTLLLGLGVAAHYTSLYWLMLEPTGVNISLFPSISLCAAIALTLQVLAQQFRPVHHLLFALLPFGCLAIIASLVLHSTNLPINEWSIALTLHVTCSLIAYGVLALAWAQSMITSHQRHKLKARSITQHSSWLPPLLTNEKIIFVLLTIGWFTLTVAIGSGFLAFNDFLAQKLTHKTLLSCSAWLLLSILLLGHFKLGWRGKTASSFLNISMVLLVLGYFGSKFALEVLIK